MSVGPFPPNQFTMPFEDRFGLEDMEHVAQLPDVPSSDAFQSDAKKCEGKFLGRYPQGLVQITLDDLELSAQQEDLPVFGLVRLQAKQNKLEQQ